MYDRRVMRKLLKVDEEQVLLEFLDHERQCERCHRAIKDSQYLECGSKIYLRRRGRGYAYTLYDHVHSRRGKFYSRNYPEYHPHKDREYIMALRMPEGSLPACRLLEALEYGVRVGKARKNVDFSWDGDRFGYDNGGYGSLYKRDEYYYGEYGPDARYMYQQ